MRPDRAGEIDYYEELGVERGASAEEVRDSFRALVRLLHPDHQQDPALKTIAEKQLRKLNRIYGVLSDPARRRSYDLTLDGATLRPSIVFSPVSVARAKELSTKFAWIGAAVLCVSAVIWVATESPPAPVLVPSDPKTGERKTAQAPSAPKPVPVSGSPVLPSAQASYPDEVSQLRAALRAARTERDEAKRELDEMRMRQEPGAHPQTALATASAAPNPSASSFTSATTSLSDSVPPRLTAVPQKPATAIVSPSASAVRKGPVSEAQKFAGFWYFARPVGGNRSNGLYYPEFIEATLTEQNGTIHGRYRSRYQILDRAISPDVNFEFNGTPTGGAMVCSWAGPGGAKGQLTLRMTGDNDMKVDWSASEVGSVQGLASGTATLTRRLE